MTVCCFVADKFGIATPLSQSCYSVETSLLTGGELYILLSSFCCYDAELKRWIVIAGVCSSGFDFAMSNSTDVE